MRIANPGRYPMLFGLSIGLIVATGCPKKADEPEEVVVTVQAAHPTQASLSEQIAADAVLAPLSQAALAPRISAPIRAEYVRRGSQVRRGQLLVALEDRDLQGNAQESRGSVLSAQAGYTTAVDATIPEAVKKTESDVSQARAALDVANRTSEERRALFQQGALAGRDADAAQVAAGQAQAAYDTAGKHRDAVLSTTRRTDAAAAKGQLDAAKGRLQSAEAQVNYAELRSPIDGIVTDRPLFPGETATTRTAVITVMDTSSLLAKLHIAQAAAQQLGLGRKAEVHIPGMEEAVEATVSLISPALDPGSTTVEIWLKLPNKNGRLKVGTSVHVEIAGDTIANALQIPPRAILPSQDGAASVMIVGADGKAHKRAVKVGLRTAEAVQILSGLSPLDTVITDGGYGLDEGAKVVVGKPGAAEDND